MKIKTIVFGIITAFALFANAELTKNSTEEEFRAVLTEMLSKTNESEIAMVSYSNKFFTALNFAGKRLYGFRAEADEALSNCFFYEKIYDYHSWPKISKFSRDKSGITTNLPYTISLAEKYKCDMYPNAFLSKGATIGELCKSMGERSVFYVRFGKDRLGNYKNCIRANAEKIIRRRLREKGISFIGEEGVANVKRLMESLRIALDSPRFAGLNDWLEEMGYEERLDISKLPSENEINELLDKIYYGEITMTKDKEVLLCVCLGIDKFNEFVKRYNGN